MPSETGTIRRTAPAIVALAYPSVYGVAVSSLGFQTVYRVWNAIDGLACGRVFLSAGGVAGAPARLAETDRPVADSRALAFSISCETEILGVARILAASGLEPLAARRAGSDPPVIVGGPLTLVDPRLVAPLADVVVVGEAEESLATIGTAIASTCGRDALIDALDPGLPGLWIPARDSEPPAPAIAPPDTLPAFAATWSPDAELGDLFLVEAARGCGRRCAFCVLSGRDRSAGFFRAVPGERILRSIPSGAPGVGLVGAAVTDHPEIADIVRDIVSAGRRVSLSSVRADRLTPRLAEALARGGLKTVTMSVDGASERLRRALAKGLDEDALSRAASASAAAGIRHVKLYAMLGLPDERDEDLAELAALVQRLDRRLRLTLSIQAFVPKPGTALARADFCDEATFRGRLATLGRSLAGRARIQPASWRWSWLDWKLAHGAERSALAAVSALAAGGSFPAWRRAVLEIGL